VTSLDKEQLLLTYDQLSNTTGFMLSAAQAGDWQRLASLEKDCSKLVARLSALETDEPLPEGLAARKAALLRKVLADDAAIRDITEPWLARLGAMLGANSCERRLLSSYGPPRPN
jgi:flagellar protein FliT